MKAAKRASIRASIASVLGRARRGLCESAGAIGDARGEAAGRTGPASGGAHSRQSLRRPWRDSPAARVRLRLRCKTWAMAATVLAIRRARRGLSEILCAGPGFHQVLTKRSLNMMANWVLASAHSRGGIFHSERLGSRPEISALSPPRRWGNALWPGRRGAAWRSTPRWHSWCRRFCARLGKAKNGITCSHCRRQLWRDRRILDAPRAALRRRRARPAPAAASAAR